MLRAFGEPALTTVTYRDPHKRPIEPPAGLQLPKVASNNDVEKYFAEPVVAAGQLHPLPWKQENGSVQCPRLPAARLLLLIR